MATEALQQAQAEKLTLLVAKGKTVACSPEGQVEAAKRAAWLRR